MKNIRQVFVILVILLLLANLVVFALKLISFVLFWAVIIVGAVIAYSWLAKAAGRKQPK